MRKSPDGAEETSGQGLIMERGWAEGWGGVE
jgi:hypothetical protein